MFCLFYIIRRKNTAVYVIVSADTYDLRRSCVKRREGASKSLIGGVFWLYFQGPWIFLFIEASELYNTYHCSEESTGRKLSFKNVEHLQKCHKNQWT